MRQGTTIKHAHNYMQPCWPVLAGADTMWHSVPYMTGALSDSRSSAAHVWSNCVEDRWLLKPTDESPTCTGSLWWEQSSSRETKDLRHISPFLSFRYDLSLCSIISKNTRLVWFLRLSQVQGLKIKIIQKLHQSNLIMQQKYSLLMYMSVTISEATIIKTKRDKGHS